MPNPRTSILCAVALTALSACGSGYGDAPSGSTPKGEVHRFRYVVEVDTPQGLVSGHSVIGMRVDCRYGLSGKQCGSSEVSEAAVVKLPDGRNLYALLWKNGQPQWTCCAGPTTWKPGHSTAYREYLPNQFPDLVMFGDEHDPKSARLIDGTVPFDQGYRIRRIYIAQTNESLTHTINQRLPWLSSIRTALGGDIVANYNVTDANHFVPHAFYEGDLDIDK